MRYARFRELGMFVGSGAAEAGCKAIIGQRLKLSGMRWSERGADAIAALRCHDASGQWAEIWTETHNQTTVADHALRDSRSCYRQICRIPTDFGHRPCYTSRHSARPDRTAFRTM
jgi:hypothetical protein